MDSIAFAIMASVAAICVTAMALKGCDHSHEEAMKCLEMGYSFHPNGSCDTEKGKLK